MAHHCSRYWLFLFILCAPSARAQHLVYRLPTSVTLASENYDSLLVVHASDILVPPGTGVKVYRYRAPDQPFTGTVDLHYANDTLALHVEFLGGYSSGTWRHYYASGKPKIEKSYAQGVLHGPLRVFHANGNSSFESGYTNGTFNHTSKLYRENGVLQSENCATSDTTIESFTKLYDADGLPETAVISKTDGTYEFLSYNTDGTVRERSTLANNKKGNPRAKVYAVAPAAKSPAKKKKCKGASYKAPTGSTAELTLENKAIGDRYLIMEMDYVGGRYDLSFKTASSTVRRKYMLAAGNTLSFNFQDSTVLKLEFATDAIEIPRFVMIGTVGTTIVERTNKIRLTREQVDRFARNKVLTVALADPYGAPEAGMPEDPEDKLKVFELRKGEQENLMGSCGCLLYLVE